MYISIRISKKDFPLARLIREYYERKEQEIYNQLITDLFTDGSLKKKRKVIKRRKNKKGV